MEEKQEEKSMISNLKMVEKSYGQNINIGLVILILIILAGSYYFLFIGVVMQTALPGEEVVEEKLKLSPLRYMIFIIILIFCIIIFLKYGTRDEIENKILEIMSDKKGRSAYQVREILNRKYGKIGISYNHVYRLMKRMRMEGKLLRKENYYYLK